MKTNTVNQAKLLLTLALTLAIAVMMTAGVMAEGKATTYGAWSHHVITPYQNSEGVYEIHEPGQLAWVAQEVNRTDGLHNDFNGQIIKLMNNIDLGGKDWMPIGSSYDFLFDGTFDGGGFTINGLTIDNQETAKTHFALFGYVNANGTVKDFSVNGSVRSQGGVTAGVAAYNSGTIENVHSSVNVSGTGYVGGIVGSNDGSYGSSATVINCSNSGNINGTNTWIGGLVGFMQSGSISNSYNTGGVAGDVDKSSNIGGISGGVVDSTNIANVYNSGAVSGNYNVGSLFGTIGDNPDTDYHISNVYYKTGTANSAIDDGGDSYTTTAFDGNGAFANAVTVGKTETTDLSVALNAYVGVYNQGTPTIPLEFWTGLSDGTAILPSGSSNSVSTAVSTTENNIIVAELLASDGAVKYRTYLAPEVSSSGSNTLFPSLHGVANGEYSLRISKINPSIFYRPHTVTGIIINDNTVSIPHVHLEQLPGTDADIGTDDLAAIADTANYNKATIDAANQNTDLNGDGMINFADLAYARNSKIFGTNAPTEGIIVSSHPADPLF